MSKLTIHLGGQKCGSSALQGYLFFGRYALAKAGIAYLDRDLGHDMDRAASHTAMLARLTEPDAVEWTRARAGALPWDGEISDYVLSTEGFCRIRGMSDYAAALAPFAQFGPVHLVLYVRPQAEVIYSGWQQWALNDSPEAWIHSALARGFANWRRVWETWRAAFPDARFDVRVFDRALFEGGDIVTDFRALTGWPAVTPRKQGGANPTFDDLTAMAIREVAQRRGMEPTTLCVSMKKAGVDLPRARDNLVFSPDAVARIRDHYAEDNAAFAAAAGLSETATARLMEPRIAPFQEGPLDPTQLSEKITLVEAALDAMG
ncbi:hypothetical protein N9W17_04135 [Jannaschia sp.]|nr:hypothetical protein [Jannaschia sp.]